MQEATLEEVVQLVLFWEVNGDDDYQCIRLWNEVREELISEMYGIGALFW